MAEPIPNFNLNEPYRYRVERQIRERGGAFVDSTRTQVLHSWDEAKWQELLWSAGAGFAVKTGVRVGLGVVGVQGLPVAILAGVATGAVVSTIKEYRRVGNFADMDRRTIIRGAVVGAIGGLGGGLLADAVSSFGNPLEGVGGAIGETFNRFGTWTNERWQDLTRIIPGTQPGEVTITPIPLATEVAVQPTAITTPQPTAEPKPTVPPTAVPKPIPTPEPVAPTPEPQYPVPAPQGPEPVLGAGSQAQSLFEKVTLVEHNPKIETAIASEVGRVLAGVPESSPLYPQIQHILEIQGHDSMENALKQYLLDHPNFDLNSQADIDSAASSIKATFVQDYNNNHLDNVIKTLTQTSEIPPVAVEVHQQAQAVTQFVTDNQTNHEVFTDHIVPRGETAGHLLQEMGITPNWDGTDVYGFVALAVSNPEAFKDIASGMGISTEDFLKLLQEAQHDPVAAQKIYKAMGLIRAGTHIKIPTHLALEEIKRRLDYGG